MKKNKAKKTYEVNIDMKWSKDYKIKATSAAEAKRIAWEKFKRNPGKSLFEILAEKEE